MEIAENIYESVVEPSYKKTTRVDSNRDGNSRQMSGVSASSKAYPEVGNHSVNLNQRYIDHPRYRSKLTYLVHGNVHSSEECKFLNEFGTRYSESRTFK